MKKKCKVCGNKFAPRYNTLEAFCSPQCAYASEPTIKSLKPIKRSNKPIPVKSKKRKVKGLQYMALRKEFLGKPENQYCPVTGKPTTEVHHKFSGKDRDKYYLDTSTWMAVSREGHMWIHSFPKEARLLGFLY